jgi:hypothetical protein
MTDVLDPARLVEAAQKAVGDGDYLAAERLLREAAAIQEATLGSAHPDLASTLNNLAFVYERMNKWIEAERGYRRAHAIAVASLGPGHPLIATSLKNLLDFCASRGIPIWTPPAARSVEGVAPSDPADGELDEFAEDPVDDPVVEEAAAAIASPAIPADVEYQSVVAAAAPAVTAGLTPRRFVVAAFGVALMAAVFVTMQGQVTSDSREPRPEAPREPSPTVPAAPVETAPAVSAESPPAARVPQTPRTATQEPPPNATNASVTVLNAQLCTTLERRGSPDWQCAAVSGDQQPGRYLFYTRLQADAATRVEHRWFYGTSLHQVIRLRVDAGAENGFRTFSSNRVSRERAGNWKVELRTADGTVLREEHFVVR